MGIVIERGNILNLTLMNEKAAIYITCIFPKENGESCVGGEQLFDRGSHMKP